MALSVTEAVAVNNLLKFLLDMDPPGTSHAADSERRAAQDAAGLLADHAHKALSGGVNGVLVREAWLKKFED